MTGSAAAVAAQAKVNLFLHILAREVSGYHQLETLFCRLTLADDVVVRLADDWTLTCDASDTGPAEENLAYRAGRLYAEHRHWPQGCAIEIVKHIPVGAGLGGGSADAAAVLRCLQALDPQPPSADELLDWGARLGADVPALTIRCTAGPRLRARRATARAPGTARQARRAVRACSACGNGGSV